MKNAVSIFRFLLEADARGERTALVTLTDVTGGSSRGPGTHMAVSETGDFAGSFSGGCIEAAVVAEAIRVAVTGVAELIRFGVGSRFIDIRLPCGGGVDLLFSPCAGVAAIRLATRWLIGRSAASLILGRDGSIMASRETSPTGWDGATFVVVHEPDLRILIVGHGAEVRALSRLSVAYGAAIAVLSPDGGIVGDLAAEGIQTALLKTPESVDALRTDAHTAVVLLFHDHDWEPALIERALDSDAFYVGAMGSTATHAQRVDNLRQRGLVDDRLTRLTGPIGLIPASRDPDTLALSVLSEIAARHQGACKTRTTPHIEM